jgi:arylsulfatase A-like enzyme
VRAVTKPWLQRTGPWATAAVVLLAIFLATFAIEDDPHSWDRRPRGGAEELDALRSRDDVNVLFILVDTLRAERLSAYGYERETSPFLEYLASTGVRFDRHLSQSSWTKASMASLWTGLYPARTGITRYDDVIPDEAMMAAERMSEAGFLTVGLYRNGWVAPTFGFDQGFEVYQRPAPAVRPPDVRRDNPTIHDGSTDEDVIASALEFLRMSGHERWLLYLHLMDLHEYVYDEASARFGADYSANYDNSILWTDRTLEILMEYLADMGYLENTVVVVTSDHGEAFLERGFEGHARRLYRETTEVPLIISFPFRLDPGIEIATRTRNVDVWPTILDLMGVPPLENVDGRSIRPEIAAAISGEPIEPEEPLAIADLDMNWARRTAEPLRTVAVAEGPFRYVRIAVAGAEVPQENLFDASLDPLELKDLAAQDLATLSRLRAEADAYEAMQPSWGEAPTREIGELELNLLRALGYQVED